jgi:hypothetical protein
VPDLIVIAGPNGAGKTTFASEYPPIAQKRLEFVNADEIARELARQGLPEKQTDLRAGRAMLERVDGLIGAGADFALETTLASLTYAQKIPAWRQRRYVVSLVYVGCLPSRTRSRGFASVSKPAATASRKRRSAGGSIGASGTLRKSTNPLSTSGTSGKVAKGASC